MVWPVCGDAMMATEEGPCSCPPEAHQQFAKPVAYGDCPMCGSEVEQALFTVEPRAWPVCGDCADEYRKEVELAEGEP